MNKSYLVICIVGLVCASSAVGATLNVPAEYPTIQSAIDAATDGDTVLVAAGTHFENLVWENKSIALIGSGADVTIIDASGSGRCLTMSSVPDTARIEGFTFTGGSVDGGVGGGIKLDWSDATLMDNRISENSAKWGGGLYMQHSDATLMDNIISGNSVGRVGGGLLVGSSSPTLTNNTISGNWAGEGGAGLWVNVSPATINNNTIKGNSAGLWGGGLVIWAASSTLANNTITGNSAGMWGGGVDVYHSSPTLTNNTIASNAGGGVYNHGDPEYPAGTPLITNCILWANDQYDLRGASATYSDIGTGQVDGEGNISANPKFVGAGDYHLQGGSPCIDAGSNAAPALPDTDKDGNPRIVGNAVDMGAYECQQPSVITVEIDIKPGSYPNSINLGSHGLIPVAILSSAEFDATTVDPDTVTLSGAGVAVRGKGDKSMAHQEDINGDGRLDLVVQVGTTNLDPDSFQDGYAILTGPTFDGQDIEGEDEITIVPPE